MWPSRDNGDEENRFFVGLFVLGIIMAFLLSLLALRLLTNIFIDVAILGDMQALSRTMQRMWLSPIRERSGQQTAPAYNENSGPNDVEMPRRENNVNEWNDDELMEQLLLGLPEEEKISLLSSMIKCKIKPLERPDDLRRAAPALHTLRASNGGLDHHDKEKSSSEYKARNTPADLDQNVPDEAADEPDSVDDHQQSSSIRSPVCPICIHELSPTNGSDAIMLLNCRHCFHRGCLCQWLSTRSRDCPYCRTEIINRGLLEEAWKLQLE